MANQAVFCGTSQHGPQKDNVGIFSSPAFVYQRGPKYTFPEMCFAYAISVPEFMVWATILAVVLGCDVTVFFAVCEKIQWLFWALSKYFNQCRAAGSLGKRGKVTM